MNTEFQTAPIPEKTPDDSLNDFHKYPFKKSGSRVLAMKFKKRLTTLVEQQLEGSKTDISVDKSSKNDSHIVPTSLKKPLDRSEKKQINLEDMQPKLKAQAATIVNQICPLSEDL